MLSKRWHRSEDGQILPVLLTAIIAVLAVTLLFLQVGRAGLLRSTTRTAADAAALAAAEAVRGMWYEDLASGTMNFSITNKDAMRDAAAEYARKNGGKLTDFEAQLDAANRRWVVTAKTESKAKQGGQLEEVKDKRAKAKSFATINLPPCTLAPNVIPDDDPDDIDNFTQLICEGDVVDSWAQGSPAPDLKGLVSGYIGEASLEADKPEVSTFTLTSFNGNLDHAKGTPISRAKAVERAHSWLQAVGGGPVPYSMSDHFPGPGGKNYRTDCSGFISMAWGLKRSLTTETLSGVAHRIDKEQLKRGDILLNSEGAGAGSHVIMFLGWGSGGRSTYIGIEQRGGDGTVKTKKVPYAYFSERTEYIPWRYDNIEDGGGNSDSAQA